MDNDPRWIELLRLREKLKRNIMLSLPEQRWLAWQAIDPLPYQPDDKTVVGLANHQDRS